MRGLSTLIFPLAKTGEILATGIFVKCECLLFLLLGDRRIRRCALFLARLDLFLRLYFLR